MLPPTVPPTVPRVLYHLLYRLQVARLRRSMLQSMKVKEFSPAAEFKVGCRAGCRSACLSVCLLAPNRST